MTKVSAIKPAAVIFDVDGTLIDSVDFHAKAWADAFEEFGCDVPFERVRRQIGKGGDKLMPVFLTKAQIKRFGDDLETFRGDHFKRRYLPLLRPFAGVRGLFERLIADGVQIALASSAKPDELEFYKQVAEIADLLDAVVSSDDVAESKPAPDIVHAALRKLGDARKDAILMIGDTPYDAQAAVRAGLQCIGVLCGGFASSSLTKGGCSAVYRSPSNILVNYDAIFTGVSD
jgi:phosphoglycolate phosphatase-like HAD superfamily hydrolase